MEQSAFENHQAWNTLSSVEAGLMEAEKRAAPDAQPYLSRLRYVVAWARTHADQGDASPYSNQVLTTLYGNLNSINSELTNYNANGNVGHLSNMETYLDIALVTLAQLPVAPLKGGAAAQANKLFGEYKRSADEAIQRLVKENQRLRAERKAAQAEHDSAFATLQSDIKKMSDKVTADEARLDNALTKNNEAFNAQQTEREAAFQAFVKDKSKSLRELASDDLDEIGILRGKAQEAYDLVDSLREGTEKVSGLASADILAGKFADYSKQQWAWGLGVNVVGFLALGVGLWVIGSTLASIGVNQTVSWQYTTLKLGVTVTIVAASAVAFRLGAIFLSRSSTSKRMELELRAIGPFFSDIEDKEVVKLAKQAFVERSFGRSWDASKSQPAEQSSDAASVVLKEIVELVKTVTSRT